MGLTARKLFRVIDSLSSFVPDTVNVREEIEGVIFGNGFVGATTGPMAAVFPIAEFEGRDLVILPKESARDVAGKLKLVGCGSRSVDWTLIWATATAKKIAGPNLLRLRREASLVVIVSTIGELRDALRELKEMFRSTLAVRVGRIGSHLTFTSAKRTSEVRGYRCCTGWQGGTWDLVQLLKAFEILPHARQTEVTIRGDNVGSILCFETARSAVYIGSTREAL